MAVGKELIHSRSDENFRKGACHGSQWFLQTSKTLALEGRTATEICDYLTDLADVLKTWRNQTHQLPDGNPWDWSFKDLADVIKREKEE